MKKELHLLTRWRKAQRVLLLLIGAIGVMLPASAQTQIYSNEFASQSDFSAMTVINANNDGSTWSYGSGTAQYNYSSSNAANDWLITPGITLEAGKTYKFDIDARARSTYYTEKLEVKMGTAPTAAGMATDVIASTDITWTSAQTLSNNSVTVTTTGVYYFGIHAISAANMWTLYVDNLVITDVTPETCTRPTNLTASNVVYNGATLTWTPGDAEQDAWQIVCGTGNFDLDAATPIDVSGTPTYTITGLEPDATYNAYVRGYCSADDVSAWSQVCTFTTPERYVKPTNLAVNDVTHNSATATWTGNNDAQSYNLRYRELVHAGLSTNFDDSSLGGWTSIDADRDGYGWVLGSAVGGVYLSTGASMAGSGYDSSQDLIVSGSYSNATGAVLTPDNYLVSPKVALGGSISFYAKGQDPDYPAEVFGVAVSTTGNTNVADFTMVGTDKTATSDWVQYTFDLSAYAGQEGYVAIRHYNCTNQFILNIDDIVITAPAGVEEKPWIPVNNLDDTSYDITGLDPETEYEVQVQAVYADGTSDWTNSVNFTTLAVPYVYPPVNLEAEGNASGAIEMNWEMPVICTEDFDDTATFPEFSLGGITSTEHSGTIGNWTLYDANEGAATYSIQNNTVPNLGSPMGWIVYALGYVNYPPHSGNQFMASFCVTSGATDHWLISPLLNGEEQTISFFARELTTNYGDETFEVLASSTDNSPTSFTNVVSLSSSSTDWTEFTASLPAGTKYFAIRHTSDDIFALFVDDVTFIPAVSTLPIPDSFNIYLDGELVGSVNGDVMSYTIQNVAPGEHECSVTAVYDGVESEPATATAIVPVPQSMTLAKLVANGEVGIRYTISEPLLAVYSVDNKLWLKDDNKFANPASPAEGDQNYEIEEQGNPHANQAEYDQSNWIEVQLPEGVDASIFNGHMINTEAITGVLEDKTNPVMTGVTLTEDDIDDNSTDTGYEYNYYCTANFVGPQNGTIAGETYHFFFMTPKPQECAKVVWAQYDAETNKMVMPDAGNAHGFVGAVDVDLSLNDGTDPVDGKVYNFIAVIRTTTSKAGNYKVYPLNISEAVITAVNDITSKTVAGVKYYNLAGIESDRPFEGVNIIVTTYTDGTTSATKVMK